MAIVIHCDGACVPNPGKGSWGIVIHHPNGDTQEISGDSEEVETTNMRMELMAAIVALEVIDEPSTIELHSDAQYLISGMTRGFKRTKFNKDLWARLRAAAERHQVTWSWVRGHNGDAGNERAHTLADRFPEPNPRPAPEPPVPARRG